MTRLPVGELLDLMITLSDNDATNALLDLVGLGAVDRLCPELGMGRTSVRRRLMDPEAARAGRDNTTCAADLARVLVLLRRGELLPPAQTALALDVLAAQQFLDGLPALLPAGVWHGNKTGELHRDTARHDAGRDGRELGVGGGHRDRPGRRGHGSGPGLAGPAHVRANRPAGGGASRGRLHDAS